MIWKKLLVALDGSPFSDGAARLAISLAAKLDASVEGLHVLDTAMMDATFVADLSGSVGFQPFLNLSAEMHEALRAIAETVAADFRSKIQTAGVRGDARIEEGTIVHQLLRASQRADAIFLGSLGVGSKRGKILGGHADALLRKIAIPAVVCPSAGDGFSRALAAFDGSERSVRALSTLRELAERVGSSIDVLTVDTDPAEIDKRRLAALTLASSPSVKVSFEAAPGHPDEEILSRLPAHDLVALGSHGHGRIVEMVLGSTTERVLRRSPVPVLCVP
ncbi:MAG: universal stress protein [Thermoanaerobaculia bacterium]